MVQATDLRDLHNLSSLRPLHDAPAMMRQHYQDKQHSCELDLGLGDSPLGGRLSPAWKPTSRKGGTLADASPGYSM